MQLKLEAKYACHFLHKNKIYRKLKDEGLLQDPEVAGWIPDADTFYEK
jgi:hypothetical protein